MTSDLRDTDAQAMSEPEAKALLAKYGVAVPKRATAANADALAEAARSLRPPFAVKIVSASGAHKSELGGVRLNVADADAVRDAVRAMPASDGGYLVEEMAPPGVEMVLGGVRHPRFGPVLMAGLGGVLVEVLDDVVFRVCPIGRADAAAMLDSLKGRALLDGHRGGPAANRAALIDAMLALGGEEGLLLREESRIAEFDVNPLVVTAERAIAVDARARLAPLAAETPRPPPPDLAPLFRPNAVAVAGASARSLAHGNLYIRQLAAFGFSGPIYPIHPTAEEIEGRAAFPSLAALPEPVDYAYIAVGAAAAPGLLRSAGGKAKFAQVMSSGFEGEAARRDLAAAASAGGARLLGPNCLGAHAPAGRLSFMAGADPTPGDVTVLAQSGGLSLDVLRRGRQRGLKYRAVVTMGDCADLGPADLVDWLLADPETQSIGLYLEDAPSGRALFEALSRANGKKPVVLLVGGRTAAGARAAQSHTGALASDGRIWDGLARQVGAALVDTLDGFLDALLACQTLRPRYGAPTRRVVLFGNGGGAGVLAADAFARAGLEIGALGEDAAAALKGLDLPAGASVANPIDVPGNVLQRNEGRLGVGVVEAALAGKGWDAFVMHMNVPGLLAYEHVDILGPLLAAARRAATGRGGASGHVALVLRSDGEPEIEAKKRRFAEAALEDGVAVFDELPAAAGALAALAAIEGGVSSSE